MGLGFHVPIFEIDGGTGAIAAELARVGAATASCPSTFLPVVHADEGSVWLRVYVGDANETTRAHGPEYDGIAHGELAVRVAVVVITLCRNYCRDITNSDRLLVAPSPSLSSDSPPPLSRLGRRPSELPKLGTADRPS